MPADLLPRLAEPDGPAPALGAAPPPASTCAPDDLPVCAPAEGPARVSLVTYIYNDGELADGLLASLADWTLKPWEIILVDDGSQPPYAPRLPLPPGLPAPRTGRLHSNRGVGVSKAHGLGLARGDFILSMDCDMRLAPDWLELSLPEASRPETGLVGASALCGGGDDLVARYLRLCERPPLPDGEVNFLPGSVWLMRREIWEAVGGFGGYAARTHEDHHFCRRVRQAGYKLMNCAARPALQMRSLSRHDMILRFAAWTQGIYLNPLRDRLNAILHNPACSPAGVAAPAPADCPPSSSCFFRQSGETPAASGQGRSRAGESDPLSQTASTLRAAGFAAVTACVERMEKQLSEEKAFIYFELLALGHLCCSLFRAARLLAAENAAARPQPGNAQDASCLAQAAVPTASGAVSDAAAGHPGGAVALAAAREEQAWAAAWNELLAGFPLLARSLEADLKIVNSPEKSGGLTPSDGPENGPDPVARQGVSPGVFTNAPSVNLVARLPAEPGAGPDPRALAAWRELLAAFRPLAAPGGVFAWLNRQGLLKIIEEDARPGRNFSFYSALER